MQLTLVRFREFMREPEALFWVFIFPILLAAGLGIAFRNRPADVLKIATVTPQLAELASARETARRRSCWPPRLPKKLCARARWRCSRCREPAAAVVYRYDDTNPEGRTARMLADRAIQRAAGRVDPVAIDRSVDARAGLALYRFPDSRPAGNEPDGQRDLGNGIRDRGCAAQEADEASDRDAHAAAITICCRSCSRGCCCWWWK